MGPPGETPIGVISAAPAILGDADMGDTWHGKYIRDCFGRPTPEISPEFDPNRAYTPRSQRPEWAMVGLLGKLILRRNQPTDPRWLRLSWPDPARQTERWLLR